jgi:RIO kinase 3
MASARVGAIGGQSISATEILPFPPADGHKCPWAHITASPPRELNLNEIMSEQLADSLQVQEEAKYLKEVVGGLSSDEEDFVLPTELDLSDLMSQNTTDCGSDELIAQMLQMQYNKEYDSNLKKVEQKYNGASKGKY